MLIYRRTYNMLKNKKKIKKAKQKIQAQFSFFFSRSFLFLSYFFFFFLCVCSSIFASFSAVFFSPPSPMKVFFLFFCCVALSISFFSHHFDETGRASLDGRSAISGNVEMNAPASGLPRNFASRCLARRSRWSAGSDS
jgi:hypothetical protein